MHASRSRHSASAAPSALLAASAWPFEALQGFDVEDLSERQQRRYTELRRHIDAMLANGWSISRRSPLTLSRDGRICHVLHGMIISAQVV